jgi:hypothetical protein
MKTLNLDNNSGLILARGRLLIFLSRLATIHEAEN